MIMRRHSYITRHSNINVCIFMITCINFIAGQTVKQVKMQQGLAGRMSYSAVQLQSQTSASKGHCLTLCIHTPGCLGLNVNVSTAVGGLCELFSWSTWVAKFITPDPHMQYYTFDGKCNAIRLSSGI